MSIVIQYKDGELVVDSPEFPDWQAITDESGEVVDWDPDMCGVCHGSGCRTCYGV